MSKVQIAACDESACAETAAAQTPWYKKFLGYVGSFLSSAARKLYSIVAPTIIDAAKSFVNDPANQAAAVAAVKAAVDQSLRGDDAWAVARAALETQLKTSGKQVAANWVDTLLQTAYFTVKNSVSATE